MKGKLMVLISLWNNVHQEITSRFHCDLDIVSEGGKYIAWDQ